VCDDTEIRKNDQGFGLSLAKELEVFIGYLEQPNKYVGRLAILRAFLLYGGKGLAQVLDRTEVDFQSMDICYVVSEQVPQIIQIGQSDGGSRIARKTPP
jgi:hypothetical protein